MPSSPSHAQGSLVLLSPPRQPDGEVHSTRVGLTVASLCCKAERLCRRQCLSREGKGGCLYGVKPSAQPNPSVQLRRLDLCTIVSASSWPLASEPYRTRRSTARERKPQAQQSTKATANGCSPVPVPTPPAQKSKQSQTKNHASKRANRKCREEERTQPKQNKSQNSQGANQSTTGTGTAGRPGKQQNETAERTQPSSNRITNQPNQAARCHSNGEPSQARGHKEDCCGHAGLLLFWPRFESRRRPAPTDEPQTPLWT